LYKNKTILAVITARGGSKRIPGKNIKMLGDKPLIAWTIEEAMKSKLIDRSILSSDDSEIISVSKSYGCETPFTRPDYLATDDATSADVVLHAVSQIGEYDYVILLQPTSPFRNSEDLDKSISICIDSNANSVVSVRKIREKPEWMRYTGDDGRICLPFKSPVKSEDLRIMNGAIYVVKLDWFLKERSFEGDGTVLYEMPWERSIDIDTMEDFLYAEFLFARKGIVEK
jgi:CMP-N-acetylneuraminic acid synthetase